MLNRNLLQVIFPVFLFCTPALGQKSKMYEHQRFAGKASYYDRQDNVNATVYVFFTNEKYVRTTDAGVRLFNYDVVIDVHNHNRVPLLIRPYPSEPAYAISVDSNCRTIIEWEDQLKDHMIPATAGAPPAKLKGFVREFGNISCKNGLGVNRSPSHWELTLFYFIDDYKLKLDSALKVADDFLAVGNYHSARRAYFEAQTFGKSEYADEKIAHCNREIDRLKKEEAERRKKEKTYNDILVKADAAFNGNRLDEAKGLYKQASDIFPDKAGPADKIARIDQIIQQREDQAGKHPEHEDNLPAIASNSAPNGKSSSGNSGEGNQGSAQNYQTEQARLEEEQRRNVQAAYDKVDAINSETQAKLDALDAATTYFENKVAAMMAEQAAYREWSSAFYNNLRLEFSSDPQEVMQRYDSQLREANRMIAAQNKEKMRKLDAEILRLMSSGDKTDRIAGAIGGGLSKIAAAAEANRMRREAREELDAQKLAIFEEIRDNLIAEHQGNVDYYIQVAAGKFKRDAEAHFLKKARFHECYIRQTNSRFSVVTTEWTNNNTYCNNPREKTFDPTGNPSSYELYNVARRKQKIEAEAFQEASMSYIDMAIKINPRSAEYFYFKSTLYSKKEKRIPLLAQALKLDKKHKNANDEFTFFHSWDVMNRDVFVSYLKDFPDGIHKEKAQSAIKYFDAMKNINQLMADKDYLPSINIYNAFKNHPAFNPKDIEQYDLLIEKVDDRLYQLGKEKDIKGNQPDARKQGYKTYLKEFPEGRNAAKAHNAIKVLDMLKDGTWGYFGYSFTPFGASSLDDNEATEKKGGMFINGFEANVGQYWFLDKGTGLPRLDIELRGRYGFRFGNRMKEKNVDLYTHSVNRFTLSKIDIDAGLWFGKVVKLNLKYQIMGFGANRKRKDSFIGDEVWKLKTTNLIPGVGLAILNTSKHQLGILYESYKGFRRLGGDASEDQYQMNHIRVYWGRRLNPQMDGIINANMFFMYDIFSIEDLDPVTSSSYQLNKYKHHMFIFGMAMSWGGSRRWSDGIYTE